MSKYLGILLLENNIISQRELEEVLKIQENSGKKLGRILCEKGFIDEPTLYTYLEKQMGVNFQSEIPERPEDKDFKQLSYEYCRERLIAPKVIDQSKIKIYINDPANTALNNELSFITGKTVHPEYATESAILNYLNQYESGKTQKTPRKTKESSEILAPAIQYVDKVLEKAIEGNASDIHFELYKEKSFLKYRLNGVLTLIEEIDPSLYSSFLSRIKVLSDLDISEKRLPQDGKFAFSYNDRLVDIRVSVIPVIYGENAVLRILDKEKSVLQLEQIGLPDDKVELLKKEARKPFGMILFTGPTGSGKTTSLYAILQYLKQFGQKIITIEDPVEYQIDGVSQVQAHTEIGLDFARGLRSFLRHDPDIIMVGEIRDKETAEVAIRAALTGHMVLSTVHTNNTASAVARFLEMGIPSYLISSTINLVIAQRLVREICPSCKIEKKLEKEELHAYHIENRFKEGEKVYFGKGCKNCRKTGYIGRRAVFEIMKMTKTIKNAVLSNASSLEIGRLTEEEDMITLKEFTINLVKAGITTLEELDRVVDVVEENDL